MSRLTKPYRTAPATKQIDLSPLRQVMRDDRTWTTIGIVAAPDDGPHFEIEDGDVMIEVITQPDQIPLTCRLLAPGGVWLVPAAGEEVGVIVPGGELGFQPIAIPLLSTGAVPDGVAEDTIVIARGKVYIHDGTGGATPLARAAHTHLDSNGMETSQAISGTAPNPAYDPMLPPGPSNPVNIATGTDGGTTTLEAL